MRQRNSLERMVNEMKKLERDFDDALTLIELGEAESDEASVLEGEMALRRIEQDAQRRSVEAMLSGEADGLNTYLEVNAGAVVQKARTGPRCWRACTCAGQNGEVTRLS